MKKIAWFFLTLCLSLGSHSIYAEDQPAATPSTVESAAPAVITPSAVSSDPIPVIASSSPAAETATKTALVTAPTVTPEPVAAIAKSAENLEFVSGEITGMDETAKTITVKLYGEAENNASDKILTIKLDENTDITDGEKDRDIKSLTNGIEVDVEYDPATNKATYIFVY